MDILKFIISSSCKFKGPVTHFILFALIAITILSKISYFFALAAVACLILFLLLTVNLILRLYELSGGTILIDGQDIKKVTLDSLRAHISLIPQDPALFHRTIMENIRYGYLQATNEEVYEAAKQANAHEFIVQLPQGYATLVGERG